MTFWWFYPSRLPEAKGFLFLDSSLLIVSSTRVSLSLSPSLIVIQEERGKQLAFEKSRKKIPPPLFNPSQRVGDEELCIISLSPEGRDFITLPSAESGGYPSVFSLFLYFEMRRRRRPSKTKSGDKKKTLYSGKRRLLKKPVYHLF
jgi:hypothetical protein